jgi:hypothetical protein
LLGRKTPEQFELQVQRTIRAQVGAAWVVRDLVEVARNGISHPRGIAPHSNEQFIIQLECSRQTVTTALNEIADFGYARWLGGDGKGQKPIFVRPDIDPAILYNLKGRYIDDHQRTQRRSRPGTKALTSEDLERLHGRTKTNIKQED